MHPTLSTTQPISQARLNGRPRMAGATRSHSATEKTIATNGIRPSTSASGEGFLTGWGSAVDRSGGNGAAIIRVLRKVRHHDAPVTVNSENDPRYQGWRVACASAIGVLFVSILVYGFAVLLGPISRDLGWSRQSVST